MSKQELAQEVEAPVLGELARGPTHGAHIASAYTTWVGQKMTASAVLWGGGLPYLGVLRGARAEGIPIRVTRNADPSPVHLIEKKRDGGKHTEEEIRSLIGQFLRGSVADYQMSAWLMAAYLRGLDEGEMRALTSAMLHSGEILSWKSAGRSKIDKHSTGGVGDKVSLPLAALVASAGVEVPMISGRGLGHTGGTLDKLEAIPGFRIGLTQKEFQKTVSRVGCAIMGQTETIAPADRRIYALRDVTGTVACRPLIVASILSKKLAAGLDGLVLDVKVGRGAFMKDLASAQALAQSLVQVATDLGTPTIALLTDMDQPLGRTIGNALEVEESIAVLRCEGPKDTEELTLALGAEMLLLAGVEHEHASALKCLRGRLESGAALEVFRQMIEAQGGDVRVVEKPNLLPRAKVVRDVVAVGGGVVVDVDPLGLAEVALRLGAGRLQANEVIDPRAGVTLLAPKGTRVERGQPLLRLHVGKKGCSDSVMELALRSVRVGARAAATSELILERYGNKQSKKVIAKAATTQRRSNTLEKGDGLSSLEQTRKRRAP